MRVPDHVLYARLVELGMVHHNPLGWSVMDALHRVAELVPKRNEDDEDPFELRVKAHFKRRVYIARYAPGISMDYLDRMSGDDVNRVYDSVVDLIGRENGG